MTTNLATEWSKARELVKNAEEEAAERTEAGCFEEEACRVRPIIIIACCRQSVGKGA